VGIINRGRLLAVGTVAEIGARLRRREHYDLRLGGPLGDIAGALAALPGVVEVRAGDEPGDGPGARIELTVNDAAASIPAAVALCVTRGLGVLECAPHGDAL
jgi:hypothetical protein